MQNNPIYNERQFLGRNVYWLNFRLVLAMFCFLAYSFSHQGEDLFLVVGISILIISIGMSFLTHFHTRVYDTYLTMDSLWTTRLVKIEFNALKSVEKVKYGRYILHNPVYNQHLKGTIRFYTYGKQALKLTDKDGLEYIIGTQNQDELFRIIDTAISAK
jgi:hypothetical protein